MNGAIAVQSASLARMFYKHRHSERVLFINTLLQRGVGVGGRGLNRFSGFRQGVETVETVLRLRPGQNTPLKQGVNEKCETTIISIVKCQFRACLKGEISATRADCRQ